MLLMERDNLVPRRLALEPLLSHGNHMSADFNREFAEQGLGQRAHRHPRRGFARTRPLENVPGVVKIVFDGAGEIGVSRPRPRERFLFVLGAFRVFHRQRVGPVLPVLVADDDPDRRPDSLRVPHAGDNFGAVGLDLHAPAAPEALLPPPKLAVDGVNGNGDSGREPGQRGNQTFSVGFTRGLKSKH
jgi:hypothetical protein